MLAKTMTGLYHLEFDYESQFIKGTPYIVLNSGLRLIPAHSDLDLSVVYKILTEDINIPDEAIHVDNSIVYIDQPYLMRIMGKNLACVHSDPVIKASDLVLVSLIRDTLINVYPYDKTVIKYYGPMRSLHNIYLPGQKILRTKIPPDNESIDIYLEFNSSHMYAPNIVRDVLIPLYSAY